MKRDRIRAARKPEANIRYGYGRIPVAGEDAGKAAAETLRRLIADWCEAWDVCDYKACFRAGRCRGVGAPCFDRFTDAMCKSLLESEPFIALYNNAVDIEEEELTSG